MSDEFLISYRPCVFWKLTGVNGHFVFKSKPFPVFGTYVRLKIVYSNSPLNGENTQILLKNKENPINVTLITDVTLKSHQYSDDYFFEKRTIESFPAKAEHCIWHRKDDDLREFNLGASKSIIFWLQTDWYFRIRISTNDRKPESIPASPAGTDLRSLGAFGLVQDLSTMFNNPYLSDVTVGSGDLQVHAHKAILALRSKFFEEEFRNDPTRKKPKNLYFKDVVPSVLEPVLRYVYSGKVPDLDSKNVRNVCKAAKKFQLDFLMLKCADFMREISSGKGASSSNPSAKAATEESKKGTSEEALLTYFKEIKDLISTLEWQKLSKRKPEVARKALKLFTDEKPL